MNNYNSKSNNNYNNQINNQKSKKKKINHSNTITGKKNQGQFNNNVYENDDYDNYDDYYYDSYNDKISQYVQPKNSKRNSTKNESYYTNDYSYYNEEIQRKGSFNSSNKPPSKFEKKSNTNEQQSNQKYSTSYKGNDVINKKLKEYIVENSENDKFRNTYETDIKESNIKESIHTKNNNSSQHELNDFQSKEYDDYNLKTLRSENNDEDNTYEWGFNNKEDTIKITNLLQFDKVHSFKNMVEKNLNSSLSLIDSEKKSKFSENEINQVYNTYNYNSYISVNLAHNEDINKLTSKILTINKDMNQSITDSLNKKTENLDDNSIENFKGQLNINSKIYLPKTKLIKENEDFIKIKVFSENFLNNNEINNESKDNLSDKVSVRNDSIFSSNTNEVLNNYKGRNIKFTDENVSNKERSGSFNIYKSTESANKVHKPFFVIPEVRDENWENEVIEKIDKEFFKRRKCTVDEMQEFLEESEDESILNPNIDIHANEINAGFPVDKLYSNFVSFLLRIF